MLVGILFQLIAAAAFVGVCIAITVQLIKNYFQSKAAALKGAVVNRLTNNESQLAAMWAVNKGTPNKAYSINGEINISKLNALLEDLNPQILTQACDYRTGFEEDQRCNSILKIGDTMLSFNYSKTTFEYEDGFAAYGGDAELYVEDNKLFISYTIEMVGNDDEVLQKIQEYIGQCTLVRNRRPVTAESVNLFELVPGLGGLQLRRFTVTQKVDPSYTDLAYEPVEIEFAGETHKIGMGKALGIFEKIRNAGSNIGIFGVPGCGKTSLLHHMATEVGKRYLIVPATTVAYLASESRVTQLIDALEEQKEYGNNVVLAIDEAETLLKSTPDGIHSQDTTFMLDLLAGTLRARLGVPVVLIFNAPLEKLNPALFRSNRLTLVNLKPLGADRAKELVKYLNINLPGRSFDPIKFDKLLKTKNYLPGNVLIANEGEITLSDVYSCFIDIDVNALILAAIRDSVPSEEVKKMEQPVSALKTRIPKLVCGFAKSEEPNNSTVQPQPSTPQTTRHSWNKKRRDKKRK